MSWNDGTNCVYHNPNPTLTLTPTNPQRLTLTIYTLIMNEQVKLLSSALHSNPSDLDNILLDDVKNAIPNDISIQDQIRYGMNTLDDG